jgi:endoglucanase
MEWARYGMRYGPGTLPNVNFTVPRRSDVSYLKACGYTKTRLPILWEMLQPMLSDTPANAAARDAIGQPGAFHEGYASYITGVLDAHAAVGTRCILDLHNFCRYQDFLFNPDGSVNGLVKPANSLLYAYTSDNTKVQMRIFALAPGATLSQAAFNDFWTRAASRWKDHPGFGGYGLMNEPYAMPAPGTTVEPYDVQMQDYTIWPTYAQAVIAAIRAVDPNNPIYLGGNDWSGTTVIANNPGWPVQASNIIYEVHTYLDAYTNGQSFDYDTEVAKNFSVGFGPVPINVNTGVDRLKIATDWAQAHGVRLALTETGMPIDDIRWQDMFQNMVNYARAANCELYSWNGGTHWALRNTGINHIPGWHQNKTLEPSMSGPMKAAWGISQASLFDDGPGWAPAGTSVTIIVYVRGNLASPLTVSVSASSGSLSKSTLTIPAGANGQDSFTFTSAPNAIATLTYSSAALAPPPPRRIYSLSDPVTYAGTSLADAAMAIIAKYSACKWEMADGYTDFMQGGPAAAGQQVRAIADSGYGSSVGNAMEMLNWVNVDEPMGSMTPPIMRVTNGKKNTDHSIGDTWGFWCRKTIPTAGTQPNPRNRVPYDLADNHFVLAAVSVPAAGRYGAVFHGSNAQDAYLSELGFFNGRPQARWIDINQATTELTSPSALTVDTPAVLSFTCVPGAQRLRVNSQVVGQAAASFAPSPFDQLMIGWAFTNYFPRGGFAGNVYSVITGKGAPTIQEMAVLERYLGSTAGIAL